MILKCNLGPYLIERLKRFQFKRPFENQTVCDTSKIQKEQHIVIYLVCKRDGKIAEILAKRKNRNTFEFLQISGLLIHLQVPKNRVS